MSAAGSISWPELIVLMAMGNGPERSISGTVRVRHVQEVADNDTADADLPGIGAVRISDSSHRVAKRGKLIRRDSLDGRPMAIFGPETRWMWLDGAELPTAFPRRTSLWGFHDDAVVLRRSLSNWDGDDFTHPTGPAQATTMLGRPAWLLELAPPAHKPFPLTLVIDAETGVVLRQGNEGFGSVIEWVDIAFGTDLPDEMFSWNGETIPQHDRVADHEREMAIRREWLATQGIGDIALTINLEVMPHDWDDATGEFEASLRCNLSASLLRRPRSDAEWDTRTNWPHNYRWSDDRWDWFIGADQEISAEQLAALRIQVGSPVD